MPEKKIKILMIAFELPPFNSGGLGEAVLGLTKSLAKFGIELTLLLPTKLPYQHTHLKIIYADDLIEKSEEDTAKTTAKKQINFSAFQVYTNKSKHDLCGEGFEELSNLMVKRALMENFDIIHGHDWMTVKACIDLKRITNKRMVLQIHATEFDRSPHEYIDKYKYVIEKMGMEAADKVIAVSKYTKSVINKFYNIPNEKIEVVYNAPTIENPVKEYKLNLNGNIILFVGRLTYQKGLHQFLETCKRVIDKIPDTMIVVAGNGDMYFEVIQKACEMNLATHIVFTGFLRGVERDIVFNSASVFLMPSISEPFGLVAVEAAQFGVPVVASKQSGVCEVLDSCIKTDFWDVELMSSEIIKILKSKKRKKLMSEGISKDLQNISWDKSALDCIKIYQKLK